MQDFTGVPAIVDLAAMRDAMGTLGGDPARINPLAPAELVIDHSVVADIAGRPDAFVRNVELEFERNRERYAFLRWGQQAFADFKVVPPGTGIVHQINCEYLARVVFTNDKGQAYPDTLVGTDSHTPMVNGLGVLGWGVGGIEAEAAMLGQPISMLMPKVVGFKLSGELPEGSTATDLVLTVTELLRRHGVVGKFVEFYGPGVGNVPVENRATIGNMSPEYGSTCAIFPIDAETLRYLTFTGRPPELVALVEAYAKEQGLWHDPEAEPRYTETGRAGPGHGGAEPGRPAPAPGPGRPDRRPPRLPGRPGRHGPGGRRRSRSTGRSRRRAGRGLGRVVPGQRPAGGHGGHDASTRTTTRPRPAGSSPTPPGPAAGPTKRVPVTLEDGTSFDLDHGHVVIAAITSCTNTSNPSVMLAAGLLARNAVDRGLASKPWVKTSLAPGSKVVMDYYERAGLLPYLEKLGFHLVGFGCTTCIGNSGPLAPEISQAVDDGDLVVASVLSGNRNFEGRINPDCRMNYLASPPLVVAYALAGTMDIDLLDDPLGHDPDGNPVYLRDLWPSSAEVAELIGRAVQSDMFRKSYGRGVRGRRALELPGGADGGELRLGRRLDLCPPPALLRRHAGHPRAGHRHPRRPGPGRAGRQRHHRPHLARRGHQARQPGRPTT